MFGDDDKSNGNTALAAGVVAAPDSVASDARYYVTTLPSGRLAQVLKRGTGKHLVLAERMAPSGASTGSAPWQIALVAVKCRVEGRDLTYEDALELDDLDILHLVAHALGKGSSAVDISPSSVSTAGSPGLS